MPSIAIKTSESHLVKAETLHGNDLVATSYHATEFGAPFDIFLVNSVFLRASSRQSTVDHNIPDLPGLKLAIVIERILVKRGLSGSEIKFLRKLLGFNAQVMYRVIGMSREHYSRIENNVVSMPSWIEKLLRIFMLRSALDTSNYNVHTKYDILSMAFSHQFDLENVSSGEDLNQKIKLTLCRNLSNSCSTMQAKMNDALHWRGDVSKAARL